MELRSPFNLLFIDLEQAFDKVKRECTSISNALPRKAFPSNHQSNMWWGKMSRLASKENLRGIWSLNCSSTKLIISPIPLFHVIGDVILAALSGRCGGLWSWHLSSSACATLATLDVSQIFLTNMLGLDFIASLRSFFSLSSRSTASLSSFLMLFYGRLALIILEITTLLWPEICLDNFK